MKRVFLFFIFILFVVNLKVEARGGQGISYYKAGFPDVAKPLLLNELTTDPLASSETCFYLGKIYFGENKTDSATFYFNKGLTGENANMLNSIGLAMLKIKSNPKVAEQEIQNVLKIPSVKKNPDYYIAAADAYLVNGLIDDAINYREKAKNIRMKYAQLAVLSGDIELAKKDVGAACSNYELAILYDDNCKEAYIKYARAYRNVNTPLAIEMLNKLKQKEPTFLLADKELADIYYATNDFDKAAKLYENYLSSGNSNPQDLVKYAMTLWLNHDFAKSLEIANLGFEKTPRNPAFNRLALYNNTDMKQYGAALIAADRLFNKSDNPDFNKMDYICYGRALKESKQFDLAIEQFKLATKLDSTIVEPWKSISDSYADKLDYPNAIFFYNKYMGFLKEDQRNADVIIELGKLYYYYATSEKVDPVIKKSSLLKADSIFAQVVTLEPTIYSGSYWRARTNFELDPETTLGLAKPYYEQTLEIVEPKAKTDSRYNSIVIVCSRYLGFYYFKKKDYTQSKVYWNKILAIEPNNDVALKAIDGIDKSLKGKK